MVQKDTEFPQEQNEEILIVHVRMESRKNMGIRRVTKHPGLNGSVEEKNP